MTSTGLAKKGERRRMYSYALIDPKDEPFLIFEYRFQRNGKGLELLERWEKVLTGYRRIRPPREFRSR